MDAPATGARDHPLPKNVIEFGAGAPRPPLARRCSSRSRAGADITVVKGSGDEIVQWGAITASSLIRRPKGTCSATPKARHSSWPPSTIPPPPKRAVNSRATARRADHDEIPHPWIPFEVLALDGQVAGGSLSAHRYTGLRQRPGLQHRSVLGRQDVPNAPGLKVAFQEKMNAAFYKDLSTDKNMGWVRPDGWLTYLTLDAPEPKVTYDMGVSSTGVIRIAPYGTAPMAVVDGVASHEWPVRLPFGTPQVALTLAILLAFGVTIFFIVRAALGFPRGKQSSREISGPFPYR